MQATGPDLLFFGHFLLSENPGSQDTPGTTISSKPYAHSMPASHTFLPATEEISFIRKECFKTWQRIQSVLQ
jgi:hypothetical protein